MRKFILLLLTSFFLTGTSLYAQTSASKLTEEEKKLVKDFCNAASVENYAGQLFMVGIPTDINLYVNDSVTEKLIDELKIGWVFVNRNNYYWQKGVPEATIRASIATFYNHIQDLSMKSSVKIPVGFAANFEGGREFSSIGSILSQPPEALTISCSGNPELARDVGAMVGMQLREIGVHVLMGPVFDIDEGAADSDMKFFNKTIQNRTFAGGPDLVSSIASYYLAGVKQQNIFTIAKHFPGYNNVNESVTTSSMPLADITVKDMSEALIPYRNLSINLDGVMTSHININWLQDTKEVTFSPKIVNDLFRNEETDINGNILKGLDFNEKISITDDLADMFSIREYMKGNTESSDISWGTVVSNAFNAGHDIFLFSVLGSQLQTYKFSIEDLSKIIHDFIEYIKNTPSAEPRFHESLYRVLLLKAQIAKSREQSIQDFLSGSVKDWYIYSNTSDDYREILIKREKGIATVEGLEEEQKTTSNIINEVLRSAYIKFQEKAPWNLREVDPLTKMAFFIDQSAFANNEYANIVKSITNRFPNAQFHDISQNRTSSNFDTVQRELTNALKSSERIYFTLDYKINLLKLLEDAYHKNDELCKNKLVILLHNTPTVFYWNYHKPEGQRLFDCSVILENCTIIGCLSTHEASYQIDFEILQGKDNLDDTLRKLPINLPAKFSGLKYNYKYIDSNFEQYKVSNQFPSMDFSNQSRRERELEQEKRSLQGQVNQLQQDLQQSNSDNDTVKQQLKVSSDTVMILLGFIVVAILFSFVMIFIYAKHHRVSNKNPLSENEKYSEIPNEKSKILTVKRIVLYIVLLLISILWFFVFKKSFQNFEAWGNFSIIFIDIICVGLSIIYIYINSEKSRKGTPNWFITQFIERPDASFWFWFALLSIISIGIIACCILAPDVFRQFLNAVVLIMQ
ncbi:hypothetical protein AGMMS49587_15790 [Spirochaetia bacterium]|nr:hypothetical protein AGMMS49587_15790 [Spirochaetia bacterium]